MAPDTFRATLAKLGWSARWVAQQCGRQATAGEGWLAGRSAVPPEVVEWLARRVASLDADPAPQLAPYRPVPPARRCQVKSA